MTSKECSWHVWISRGQGGGGCPTSGNRNTGRNRPELVERSRPKVGGHRPVNQSAYPHYGSAVRSTAQNRPDDHPSARPPKNLRSARPPTRHEARNLRAPLTPHRALAAKPLLAQRPVRIIHPTHFRTQNPAVSRSWLAFAEAGGGETCDGPQRRTLHNDCGQGYTTTGREHFGAAATAAASTRTGDCLCLTL